MFDTKTIRIVELCSNEPTTNGDSEWIFTVPSTSFSLFWPIHWITNSGLEIRPVKARSTVARPRASVELGFVPQWIDSWHLFILKWASFLLQWNKQSLRFFLIGCNCFSRIKNLFDLIQNFFSFLKLLYLIFFDISIFLFFFIIKFLPLLFFFKKFLFLFFWRKTGFLFFFSKWWKVNKCKKFFFLISKFSRRKGRDVKKER